MSPIKQHLSTLYLRVIQAWVQCFSSEFELYMTIIFKSNISLVIMFIDKNLSDVLLLEFDLELYIR